jgi:hypothetical protein
MFCAAFSSKKKCRRVWVDRSIATISGGIKIKNFRELMTLEKLILFAWAWGFNKIQNLNIGALRSR